MHLVAEIRDIAGDPKIFESIGQLNGLPQPQREVMFSGT